MTRFFKEPLVHFLAGAALIFVYFWAIGANRDPLAYEISISQSDVDRIAADAMRSSQRIPTHEEISALVDQAVKEEIYYREALRLGLDDGDAVIRRRLSNKMRSLNNAEIGTASEAQLEQFLSDNAAKYGDQKRYAFDHIYIGRASNPQQHKQWLAGLRNGSINADDIKAPLSIDMNQTLSDEDAITRKFGSAFTDALDMVSMKKWDGPIPSGFGLHFVKISDKSTVTPKVSDIRQQVSNDWRAEQIAQSEKETFEALSKDYQISIAPIR